MSSAGRLVAAARSSGSPGSGCLPGRLSADPAPAAPPLPQRRSFTVLLLLAATRLARILSHDRLCLSLISIAGGDKLSSA